MKKLLIGFIVLIPLFSKGQFVDDFSDGDFTNNPIWSGDTSKFNISGTNILQSNGNPSGTDTLYMSTPSKSIINAEWSFLLDMAFNPTTSNYFKIFLVSDNNNLESSLNGYFLKVQAPSGSDSIELWRKDGATETKLMAGNHVFSGSAKGSVKVTRDSLGLWKMYLDPASGTSYVLEDSIFDNTYTSSDYFGVYFRYSTASRFDMFLIDDFNVTGSFLVDNTAPKITSVIPSSSTELDVFFDEKVDPTTAQTLVNYQVNNSIGVPTSATLDGTDTKLVHLTFANEFTNETDYILSANNIEDLNSNTLSNEQVNFTYFIPSFKDIIINEIFPDPSPSIGMPDAEFIELYNNTSTTINLAGYQITDGSNVATISSFDLKADTFVILCANADLTTYSIYGDAIGLSSWPSLNNSGDNLKLYFPNGDLMDEVNYSDSWYNDSEKKLGGYTLELIDPNNPCAGDNNWSASENVSGGTPGRRNSINSSNPDLTPPQLLKAIAINPSTVLVYYNEKLDAVSTLVSNYSIDNNITITSNGLIPELTTDTLKLSTPLDFKTKYTVTATNMFDCSGNIIGDVNSAEFALPEAFGVGDIIINEILFNARSGSQDFVELYNKSDKYIDLQEVTFLRSDDSTYTIYPISNDYLIIEPNGYLMLSEDIESIKAEYPLGKPENYYEINDLPSYSDSEGEVIIGYTTLTNKTIVLDSVFYLDDYHFDLIDDKNGVSLERVDFNQPSENVSNWHSAASSVGYATPGYINSSSKTITLADEGITIDPEIFTPNDDGYNDFTTINFKLSEIGYVANITIFDSYGRLIKRLVQNELLAVEGFYQWNGTNEEGRKALVGNYVILFEIFDTQGNKQRFKKVVSVGANF